jgi:drug/metabolite transporter (DMT)-like permease
MSVFLAFIGQMLLKKAAISNTDILTIFLSCFTWIGLFCYFVGALLWIIALSKIKLIYAYPFTFLTFALVIGGAFFIFGEKINIINLLIGFALIVSGIIIINLGK